LEDQLNEQEIDEIIEHELSEAKTLVEQKKQEAGIYISYLRKEADRLEHQVELLDNRLTNKEDAEWLENFKKNSEKSRTINLNRARNAQRQRMGRGRQHLLNVRKKN
jgi:hypothetical protein